MPSKSRRRGPDWAKEIRHRINAGRVAVEAQIPFFRDQLGRVSREFKEDQTPVTFADYAISEKVIGSLSEDFPEDVFCSEESNPADEVLALDTPFSWIIDPIDGTKNFADGYPVCSISLALLKGGTPIYGFVYDMTRDVLIEGGPDFGVTEKRKKLRPEHRSALDRQTTIGLHFPMKPEILCKFEPLMSTYRVRSLGSAALAGAYIGNGLMDGVIDFKVSVWDIAAAYAIALGAGAEFHFIEEDIFPMTSFHVNQGKTPFYSGSPVFCRYVESLLRGS
ncbi:MAG: inositol monophosphatase family protein [Opitutales bacterium]